MSSERAALQFLTEETQKLGKRLAVLEGLHESDLKELTVKVEGIGSSVTQYASVIDQIREEVTKLPAEILGQVDKALKEGSKQIVEASKLYVDQRIGGQPVQSYTTNPQIPVTPSTGTSQGWGRVGEQISQRIPDLLNKAIDKFVLGNEGPQGLAINPNLAGRVNRAIEKMATRNMEEFALGLEKKLGLTSESIGPSTAVTHG